MNNQTPTIQQLFVCQKCGEEFSSGEAQHGNIHAYCGGQGDPNGLVEFSEAPAPPCDCTHTQACHLCAESKEIDWKLIEAVTTGKENVADDAVTITVDSTNEQLQQALKGKYIKINGVMFVSVPRTQELIQEYVTSRIEEGKLIEPSSPPAEQTAEAEKFLKANSGSPANRNGDYITLANAKLYADLRCKELLEAAAKELPNEGEMYSGAARSLEHGVEDDRYYTGWKDFYSKTAPIIAAMKDISSIRGRLINEQDVEIHLLHSRVRELEAAQAELIRKHAEGFLEWTEKGKWWKSTDTRFLKTLGRWNNKINGDVPYEQTKTTADLFSLYLQENESKPLTPPTEEQHERP